MKQEAPKTKIDSYELLKSGRLGNYLRVWNSFEDMLADPNYTGDVVALRLKSTPGVRPPQYCVATNVADIPALVQQWNTLGYTTDQITFNECDNIKHITIQGEVYRNNGGLSLRYSYVKAFMLPALQEQSLLAEGLKAKMILEHYLDSPSYENLIHLLDTYDGNSVIVEFSAHTCGLGVEGWNTVFWELRNY